MFCSNCGASISDNAKFCSECGTPTDGTRKPMGVGYPTKSKSSTIILSLVAVLVVLVIAGAVGVVSLLYGKDVSEVFDTAPVQVDSIRITPQSKTMLVGDTTYLQCTILPSEAIGAECLWSSSDDNIASVDDNGKVTAKAKGICTVTVLSDGKSDSISVTVNEPGPDLAAIYEKYEYSNFVSYAQDGSYLAVDTNPGNVSNYFNQEALDILLAINKELGAPDSVGQKMQQTRALDGRQDYSGDGYNISWTFHPNYGLEVTYELDK